MLGCPKAPGVPLDAGLPEAAAPSAAIAAEPLVTLRSAATSENETLRARAMAILIEVDPASAWGATGLGDESTWVQRSTVDALERRGDSESRALLEALAGDPSADPYVRSAAALGAPGPASAAAMSAAWRAEAELWRQMPLALAASRLGDKDAASVLVTALKTGEIPLDLAFVSELGTHDDPAVLEALGVAQGRVEDELVLPIASARLRLGDASAEQELRQALIGSDEEGRLEAIDCLVDVDHDAATALLRRASQEGPVLVTWYADLALAERLGTDPDVFARAMETTDREVRVLAVRFAGRAALRWAGRKPERAAERVVLVGLSDLDASVRQEAATATAALGSSDAGAALQVLLADPVVSVRVEAAYASIRLAK